jgi:Raf kinase inhibitor-like YbhB/YbcL family protein
MAGELLGVGRRRVAGLGVVLVTIVLALSQAGAKESSMQISSPSFTPQGSIPSKYTCEGSDTSPPLAWSGAPSSAKSLALIVDDPDAPDPAAPKMTWVHWVLYNLPTQTAALGEGAAKSPPAGARDGLNDWKRPGYGGPCPPIGRHRYFFKLYALDVVLPDLGKPSKAALLKAMEGHVVASAELVGTYQKGQ